MKLFITILIFIIGCVQAYFDIKCQMIYSPLNWLMLVLGTIITPITANAILGACIIPGTLWIINSYVKEIIGEGDIEFIIAIGFIIGFQSLIILIVITAISSAVYMLSKKVSTIPLIPFLYGSLCLLALF